MDWTCELFFDNIMHHSVCIDPGQLGKGRAGDANPKVGFAFRASASMADMPIRVIKDLQQCGLKVFVQFFLNRVLDGHGEEC